MPLHTIQQPNSVTTDTIVVTIEIKVPQRKQKNLKDPFKIQKNHKIKIA